MTNANAAEGSARLSIGQCATLACLFEATAAKPGNVHRGADFDDLTFVDFSIAATAIGPAFDDLHTGRTTLGESILAAVQATRRLVATNVNLGMVLLIAPLAAVRRDEPLATGVAAVLSQTTPADADHIYQAIRAAQPGGLGQAPEADVAGPPPESIVAAMRLAADRDLVARQWTNDFDDVLHRVGLWLRHALAAGRPLHDAIVEAHIRMMASEPDSLIARKAGRAVAVESSARAAAVLAAGPAGSPEFYEAASDLDFWLRSDGRRRNPGTTADLIAAGLFALLRDGQIPQPIRWTP